MAVFRSCQFLGFVLVANLLMSLPAYSEEPQPAAPQKPNDKPAVPKETLDAIRASIVENSSFEVESFAKIAATDVPPNPDDFASQPLSLVLCFFMQPWHLDEAAEKVKHDFAYDDSFLPPPATIAKGLYTLPNLRMTAVTLTSIKDLTCEIKDNQASGVAKIRMPDIFTANVRYQARLIDGKWQVQEFTLPAWDLKFVKQENKTWKATGLGIKRLPLKLPSTPRGVYAPARDDAALRFRVNVGFHPEDALKEANAKRLVSFAGDKLIPLMDYQKALPEAIKAFAENHKTKPEKIALSLWADKNISWGRLEKLLRVANQAGVQDIRLVVSARTVKDDFTDRGEFRIKIPKAENNLDLDLQVAIPKRAEIQADGSGKIASISMIGRKFSEQEAQAEVKRFANSFGDQRFVTIAVEIQADPELLYENLLKVLSTFGELKEGDTPGSKIYIPLFSPLLLPEAK